MRTRTASNPWTGLPFRVAFALALGAVEVWLRLWFPRLMQALTPRAAAERDVPCAELQRIESDPAYRALFFAELGAAITDRDAEREAMVHAVEAAAARLRSLVVPPDSGGRGA
ncbi:hypothetical protein [Streptomyces sp. cmx-18-6]|uniref:hypothetical protein n=1 Tax=Streptomyces sp. cmx-18-6 TaxID=2790930 RepID=UPI0039812910